MKKKPFVIDYQIDGTLHLHSPNHIAVALRAEGMIRRALADLKEISVYCEEAIDLPIDAEQRYVAKVGKGR